LQANTGPVQSQFEPIPANWSQFRANSSQFAANRSPRSWRESGKNHASGQKTQENQMLNENTLAESREHFKIEYTGCPTARHQSSMDESA
jgi:protease II